MRQSSPRWSLRVLAIGNSLGEDATRYLWDICRDAGGAISEGEEVHLRIYVPKA